MGFLSTTDIARMFICFNFVVHRICFLSWGWPKILLSRGFFAFEPSVSRVLFHYLRIAVHRDPYFESAVAARRPACPFALSNETAAEAFPLAPVAGAVPAVVVLAAVPMRSLKSRSPSALRKPNVRHDSAICAGRGA